MRTNLTRCWSLVFIILVFLPPQTLGQRPISKSNDSGGKGVASSDLAADAADQRLRGVVQVRGFATQLLAFHDVSIRAPAIARLAEILWKDDQPYAEQLFLKAYDSTSLKNASSREEQRTFASLRRQVLSRMARCAPALVDRLIKDEKFEDNTGDQAKAKFSIAYDLSNDDPTKANDFARASLKTGVNPGMYALLLRLRSKDEKLADALFLETLQRLTSDPAVDANDLLALGTYVFTSSKEQLLSSPAAIVQVVVGDLLVPDITADRPNIPLILVRSYLNAAANVVMRPSSNLEQQKLYYVTCYLLLPKAIRFAPEVVPSLTSAMQSLAKSVPPQLTNESTYSNVKKRGLSDPNGLELALKEIERMPDQDSRDIRYLSLTFVLCMKADFSRAREIAKRISDLSVAQDLEIVISFNEGARLLEKKAIKLSEVKQVAERLPQGIERAMLWIAIAKAEIDANDTVGANTALDDALTSARKVDDVRLPFLTMNLASQWSRIDRERGETMLIEAIKQFNAQKPAAFSKVEWRRKIELGPDIERFPLKVKGFAYQMEEALQPLIASDSERTAMLLQTLSSEQPLAEAIIAMSKVVLNPK